MKLAGYVGRSVVGLERSERLERLGRSLKNMKSLECRMSNVEQGISNFEWV